MKIIKIALDNKMHCDALMDQMSLYATDIMGGGDQLSLYCQKNLIPKLKKREDYHAWLAFDGEKAIGILNAFESFSTFYAQPLLNIHDLAVTPAYRNKGVATQLMQQAEQFSIQQNYCKLTLEVLTENELAKHLYKTLGYAPYQLSATAGVAEFWQKQLTQVNTDKN